MKSIRLTAFILLLIVVLFALLSSCKGTNEADGLSYSAAVTPTLTITGDVENVLTLTDYAAYAVKETTYKDGSVPSIALLSVLEDVIPVGKDISLFFVSSDGVMAEVTYAEIDENSVLLLTSENGWQFYSEKHPPQSGIKQMEKIVVCAKETMSTQKCFRVIYGEEYLTLTYGQLFNAEALTQSVLEGEAQMHDTTTNVYTKRELIPLDKYIEALGATTQSTALAYFGDNSQKEIDIKGYIEWRGNSVDYIGTDKKSREKDIIGIWIDAPEASVTDISSLALDRAKEGRVMIIELDGAGYYNILEHTPEFISSKSMMPGRTVMPSISNVSLAAIVTGELPSVNGVTARGMHELLVDDMFAAAEASGLKCAVVEGSSQLITMSIKQTLNPDTNGDGYTDSEVQATALEMIEAGSEFVYIHFHGYDDVAHTYGPSSEQAAKKLDELDGYVSALCASFKGTVIITADHGQHTTTDIEKIGNHGEFLPMDMTVPIIVFEVG